MATATKTNDVVLEKTIFPFPLTAFTPSQR